MFLKGLAMCAQKAFSRCILLIEDHPMVARILQSLFEAEGCEVTIANTGKKALACFNAMKFDLILCDIDLPDMKGFDITKKIRKKEKDLPKRTPIIGMSSEDHRKDCLDAGMDDFYLKPLLQDQITKILKICT
jgi:CheY-like chemotaxis protein